MGDLKSADLGFLPTAEPESSVEAIEQIHVPGDPPETEDDDDDNDSHQSLGVDSEDTESALGGMGSKSATTSIKSIIYRNVEENGRTYHSYKGGKYLLPNDENEQYRLDIQHHLFLIGLHGNLHLAPLSPLIKDVLDIATGTGIWATDFAVQYPLANVLGTDLSPIQPEFIPPNCRFEIDDAEDDWTYIRQFDYIHGRLLLSCFNNDFPGVIAKAYAALKPGGWLELQDSMPPECFDDSWNGSAVKKWVELTVAGAKALGMDWGKVNNYERWVKEAGFEEVTTFHESWPMNPWAKGKRYKQLGILFNIDMMNGVEAVSLAALTRGLGMNPEEVKLFLVDVKRDFSNRKIHCFAPVRVVYGRKPGGPPLVANPSAQVLP